MTRLMLCLITLTYSLCSNAQLAKTWISRSTGEALFLTNDYNYKAIDRNQMISKGTYSYLNDTIRIIKNEYYITTEGKEIFNEWVYPYRVLSLAKDSMVLIRMHESNMLGYQQDTIILDDYNTLYDSSFSFNRIYFHTTACNGTCPDFKIEIYRNGLVYFYGRLYTGKYKGTYKGHLNSTQLNELLHLLKGSNIRNIPSSTHIPMHGPERRLVVEYKNEGIDFCGSNPPYTANQLFVYLITNFKKFKLKKCTGCRAFTERSCYIILREERTRLLFEKLQDE